MLGQQDEHLKRVEHELGVAIVAREGQVLVRGEAAAVASAKRLFCGLLEVIRAGQPIERREVEQAIRLVQQDAEADVSSTYLDRIDVPSRRRFVRPRSPSQHAYVEAMRRSDMVFAIGPAGTGKTYLAMAMAVAAWTAGEVSRLVLTRPAVEAGEKLGFLPGTLQEKINPYLRPLYDALYDMMDVDRIQRAIDRGAIEVAPLAFMRGRTLNGAFIILDEAQNTTADQMKMFLTRLGFDSKAVITGDVTQVDLPKGRVSGLVHARQLLSRIPSIRFVEFSKADVVRHELVQRIIEAYEAQGAGRRGVRAGRRA